MNLCTPHSIRKYLSSTNDQVPQQVSLEIDLPVGYELTLIVDNYIIPKMKYSMLKLLVFTYGNLELMGPLNSGVLVAI